MAKNTVQTVEPDCASFNVNPTKARAGLAGDPDGNEELTCPFSILPDSVSGAAR